MIVLIASGMAFLVAFDPDEDDSPATSTPAAQADGPVQTPAPRHGLSRAQPAPVGTLASTTNWEVEVPSFERGTAATALVGDDAEILAAWPGSELLAVEVSLRGRAVLTDAIVLDFRSFALSGSQSVRYDALDAPAFPLALEAVASAGGQVDGYLLSSVGMDERDFILEFRPIALTGSEDYLFLAVTSGATPSPPEIPAAIDATAGMDETSPAAPGTWVTNGIVAARVLDVRQGAEARTFIISELAGDPTDIEDDATYAAVHVEALNVARRPDFVRVSLRTFSLGGNAGAELVDQFTVRPILDARLYPGGREDGWLIIAYQGVPLPTLVLGGPNDDQARFMALE